MVIKTCKICDKPINESEKWRRRTCRKCYNEMWREYRRKYRKEYYEAHKEELKEYRKEYRKSHKEEFKKYREKSKSNYIYVIIYNNEVSYVGSTTNINNRITYHINGYSSIDEKWNYIYYLDVTNMLTDKITLQTLEQILFNHYKPEFNIYNPIAKINIPIPKQKIVLQQLLNSKDWKMYNKVHEVLRAIGGDKE